MSPWCVVVGVAVALRCRRGYPLCVGPLLSAGLLLVAAAVVLVVVLSCHDD